MFVIKGEVLGNRRYLVYALLDAEIEHLFTSTNYAICLPTKETQIILSKASLE